MVDGSANVPPAPTRVVFKDLQFEPRNIQLNLEKVLQLLSSLRVSGITQIVIPEPLYLRMGSKRLSGHDYKVTSEHRDLENPIFQEAEFYYTDVAHMLLDIHEWVETSFSEQRLSQEPESVEADFTFLKQALQIADPNINKDDYLIRNVGYLQRALNSLIETCEGLASGEGATEAENVGSIGDSIHQLETNPQLALRHWERTFLPLFDVLANTQLNTKVLPIKELFGQATDGGHIRVDETRLLLRAFILALRKIVETKGTPTLLLNELQNRPIKDFLTQAEIDLILSSDSLLFADQVNIVYQTGGDPGQYNPSDKTKVKDLDDFLIERKVMSRLLGVTKFSPETGAVAEETTEDSGGEDQTPEVPAAPTISPDQLRAIVLTRAAKQLETEWQLTEYLANEPAKLSLLDLILTQLTADLRKLPIIIDASTLTFTATLDGQEISRISLFNAETNQVTTGPQLDKWIVDTAAQLVADFRQALGNPDQYVADLVAQAKAALDQMTNPAEAEQPEVGQAQVPNNLDQLLEEFRKAGLESTATLLASEDTWRNASQAEKLLLIRGFLGSNNAFTALVISLHAQQKFNDPALANLRWEDLPEEYRQFFLDEVNNAILNLQYDDVVRLLEKKPSDLLGISNLLRTRIATRLAVDSTILTEKFKKFTVAYQKGQVEKVEAGRLAVLSDLEKELNLERDFDTGNLERSLDTFLILVKDPYGFVSDLNAEKLQKYFNITLSSDPKIAEKQLQRYKDLITRYLQLRQQQINAQGATETEDELDQEFGIVREYVGTLGASTVARGMSSGYGDELSPEEFAKLTDEEQTIETNRRAMTLALVAEMWKQLPEEYRAQYYVQDPGAQDTGQIPQAATAADLMSKVYQASQAKQGRLQQLRNAVSGKAKPSTQAGLLDAAKKLGLSKLAYAAPYVGQAKAIADLIKSLTGLDWKTLVGGLMVGMGALAGMIFRLIAGSPMIALGTLAGGLVAVVTGNPLFLVGGATGGALASGAAKGLLGGGGGAAASKLATGATTAKGLTASTTSLAKAGVPSFTAMSAAVVSTVGAVAVLTFNAQQLAFVDPLPILNPATGEFSKYVTLDKQVNPLRIENNTSTTISYTITITPKEGFTLTPAEITDEISYLGGDALQLTSPIEEIRAQLGTEPISETKTITYSLSNVSGVDVLVANAVTFKFTVTDESGVVGDEISDTGSLTIGNPKIGCFEFGPSGFNFSSGGYATTSKEWDPADKDRVLAAFANRAGLSTKYVADLCKNGPITIYNLPGGFDDQYGGWAPSAYLGEKLGIYDYGLSFSGTKSLEYTLTHELGHIYDYRNPGKRSGFEQVQTAGGTCYTYPIPSLCSEYERFAEGMSLYVISATYDAFSGGIYNFKGRYRPEYDWLNTNVYGREFQ